MGLSMNPSTLDIPIPLNLFETFSSTSNVGAEPEDSCLLRNQNLTAAQPSLTQTKAYLLTNLLASLGARIILKSSTQTHGGPDKPSWAPSIGVEPLAGLVWAVR